MLFNRYKIFCLVLICGLQSSFGQTAAISDPTGNWWLGFNIGGTYHNSDVETQGYLGYGMTLEGFLINDYFSPIALSLRGRYLGGELRGLDSYTSTNTLFNNALNGANDPATDYNTGGEKVVHNFRSVFHNLGLEAVLYLNALRKVNVNFYVFGGADIMWYQTTTDQLDKNGNRYDYDAVDLSGSKSENRTNLEEVLDGEYETAADGNDGSFSAAFAPAFGVGLGYIFNKRWSLGVEHKVTFPITDLLDGQQWNATNLFTGDNDFFHYTSLTLGFGFGGDYGYNEQTTSHKTVVPPPSIQMVWPANTTYHSASCEMNIVATLYNVEQKEAISVYQNGIAMSPLAITYDAGTGRLQVQTQISEATKFRIVVNTPSGTAEKVFNITCGAEKAPIQEEVVEETVTPTAPKLLTPYIDFETPTQKTITTSDCQMNVVAYLPNTDSKSYISVFENGKELPTYAYYFSVANKKLSINKEFSGKTTLTIKVTNTQTEISETLTYNCVSAAAPTELKGQKPEIIMLKPTENPYRTLECEVEIMAEVLNIDDKNQISIRQNGTLLSSGDYQYNPGTRILKLLRPIQKFTRVEILASNKFGEDTESLRLQCEPPTYQPPVTEVAKPFISMQSSYANPAYVTDCKANFDLSIYGINSKGDVSINVNGSTLSPSYYTYNTSSRILNINTSFDGKAEFIITARNSGGVSSYTQAFECKKPDPVYVAKPSITIITPSTTPLDVEDCKAVVEASITGIKDKNYLVVKFNNNIMPPHMYSYNAASKEFYLMKPFEETANITIAAKNGGGVTTKSVKINCVPKTVPEPVLNKPSIKMVAPKVESFASATCSERVYGTIEFVDTKGQITVLVNNRPHEFTFSDMTKRFTLDVEVVGTTTVKIQATNAQGTASKTYVMTCEKPVLEPSITILSPTTNPYSVKDCRANIIAQTKNVTGKTQVEVTENGKLVPFEFNAGTGVITINSNIQEGTATYTIEATTEGGTVLAKQQIVCEKPAPVLPKPVVTIIKPTSNPHEVKDCQAIFSAAVQHAEKANISLSVNDVPTNFTYDEANNIVSLTKSFEGTIVVELKAKNTSGTTSLQRTFVCKPKVPEPVVAIIEPSSSPYVTENCNVRVVASVQHVTSKEQITVSSGGKQIPFSFDPTTKIVETQLFDVQETKIQVKAQNESGFSQAEVTIKCTPPPAKPVVTIKNPLESFVKQTTCKAQVDAVISPADVDDIRVNFGGVVLTSSNYEYDGATGKLRIDKPYEKAVAITITATNKSGKGTASVQFNCEPKELPIPAPEVNVVSPTKEVSTDCVIDFVASVQNVKEASGINLYENGGLVPPANYQFANNTVTYTKSFTGEVTIKLVAKNTSGEKAVTKKMVCQPPVPKPTVTITDPAENPFNITECETPVRAIVLNVTKKEQITVTQNGSPIEFLYNPEKNQVKINHTGKGRYDYEIKAKNESGTATALQTIVCTPPKPEIKFIVPQSSPFETKDCNMEVKASVLNVSEKSDIAVTVNGQPVNFIYNEASQIVEFPLESSGTSNIIITASTPQGKANATMQVICVPPTPKPTVAVISPSQNPYTTQECNVKVEAKTTNITSKNQIKVTANGVAVPFNFNQASEIVTIQKEVDAEAAFVIQVSNEGGEAATSISVKCKVPVPQISLVSPSTTPYETKECKVEVKAEIQGVTDKSQVKLLVNGGWLASEEYSFNNGFVTYNLNDFEGTVPVKIEATNKGGKAVERLELTCVKEDKKVTICHYPPGNRDNPQTITISENAWPAHLAHGDKMGECVVVAKPVIAITNPTGDVTEIQNCRASVSGNISNVLEKSSVTITVNNTPLTDFTFNNGTFSINNYEFKGDAVIKITAKNASGETSVTKTFKCIDKKIGICHYPPGNRDNPQFITVPENAWKAHEAHGDVLGECPVLQKPVLNIQQPGNHQSGVTDCNIDVKARTYHILEQSSIAVSIDGKAEAFKWDGTNITFDKKVQPGNHQVIITATNGAGTAKQVINYVCEAPKKEVDFGIENGSVVPKDKYNAEVKLIGCALKSGSTDLPVMVQVNFGGTTVDPFGTYAGFNKSSDVNNGKQQTWTSKQPISANTAITIKAKSFMPGKTTPLHERSSNTNSQFVKVLRDGDNVPNVSGYAGQADAETYLKPYIQGNKIKLEKNQAIYLFELGTNDAKSAANDMQDCVIVVTLTPAE